MRNWLWSLLRLTTLFFCCCLSAFKHTHTHSLFFLFKHSKQMWALRELRSERATLALDISFCALVDIVVVVVAALPKAFCFSYCHVCCCAFFFVVIFVFVALIWFYIYFLGFCRRDRRDFLLFRLLFLLNELLLYFWNIYNHKIH